MSNRDATKKARGYSYQRQYAILIFFESVNTDVDKIVEEGNINKLYFEDVTTINKNNEYVTYQLKHHTGKMCFNRSNKDLFKTIKNKDNMKAKEVHFIVSRNEETFDDFFNKWKELKD